MIATYCIIYLASRSNAVIVAILYYDMYRYPALFILLFSTICD